MSQRPILRHFLAILDHGNRSARLRIRSGWRRTQRPPLMDSFPEVVGRVGIDLPIVNVNVPHKAFRLRSLAIGEMSGMRT